MVSAATLPKLVRSTEEGVELALSCIERFVTISREVGAGEPDAVATAAVREARNGFRFVERVRERCGLEVRVLTGVDEARLSALGAMSAIPDADGVIGDIGGGSLELVVLNSGEIGDSITLPLGALRLMGLTPQEQVNAIDLAVDGVPWLKDLKNRNFLCGRWCLAFARAHPYGTTRLPAADRASISIDTERRQHARRCHLRIEPRLDGADRGGQQTAAGVRFRAQPWSCFGF